MGRSENNWTMLVGIERGTATLNRSQLYPNNQRRMQEDPVSPHLEHTQN